MLISMYLGLNKYSNVEQRYSLIAPKPIQSIRFDVRGAMSWHNVVENSVIFYVFFLPLIIPINKGSKYQ